jgi:hypothetical protein
MGNNSIDIGPGSVGDCFYIMTSILFYLIHQGCVPEVGQSRIYFKRNFFA